MIIFKIKMKKFLYSRLRREKGFNFNKLSYGNISLKSISSGYISKKQKEMLEQIIRKNTKNYKFNLNFNKKSTRKALETRMGGGKGMIKEELYYIKSGSFFLEFYNVSLFEILYIFKVINRKLSLKLKLVYI